MLKDIWVESVWTEVETDKEREVERVVIGEGEGDRNEEWRRFHSNDIKTEGISVTIYILIDVHLLLECHSRSRWRNENYASDALVSSMDAQKRSPLKKISTSLKFCQSVNLLIDLNDSWQTLQLVPT